MKKIRFKSRKGFTLVEVMLSVAILAIASTMIMHGFLAVMNYSLNSNVIARAAASNYATCIAELGSHASTANIAADNQALVSGGVSSSNKITVSCSGASPCVPNGTVWTIKPTRTNADLGAMGYNAVGNHTSTQYNEDVSVIDNRVSFVYVHMPSATAAPSAAPSASPT